MPYEKKRSKVFLFPFQHVYRAAYNSAKELGGKILKNEPEQKILHVQMDKRIKGETLGDRTKFEISFSVDQEDQTTLSIFAYPLNAVGQKLMFGARKGVVDWALDIFFEDLEKRLENYE
jgi:hypothetical protein